MDEESIAKVAGLLFGVYASGVPVAPLTADYPGLSAADVYAIQLAQLSAWTAGGARVHVVLPGSVSAVIPFGPGDTVSATFDRIGSVSITFSEKS